MASIQLIVPTEAYLPQILAYKRAFETKNLLIHGSQGLDHFQENELFAWLDYLNSPEGTNRFGYEVVASSTFLAWEIDQQKMVGIINIRHKLNDYLLKVGGHIGYSVHPDCWNQGYGSEMLALGLKECGRLNLTQLLLTCDKSNRPSEKVILKNGGVLENELVEQDRIVQRYWITLE